MLRQPKVEIALIAQKLTCALDQVRLISQSMPKTIRPAALTKYIQALMNQRAKHAAALRVIDETLDAVRGAIGGSEGPRATNGNGGAQHFPKSHRRSGRRRRQRFSMSGEESVLAFVRQHGSPTTRDVRAHWEREGRGGSSDNALSKLVKEKKLKRIPLKGERGSRYQAT